MDFERRRADLARRIAAAQQRRRRGKVYPPELRRDIDAFVRDAASAGRSLYAMAQDLGVSQTTLVRWKCQARRDPGLPHLRPVSVLPMPPTFTGAVSVLGPRGLRIEGLDLDGVAELIRRLG
jgi:transposase-like protein